MDHSFDFLSSLLQTVYCKNHWQKKIEALSWKLLPHAPYSPDLAPSDYFLFRSFKHYLEGIHFDDHEQVVKALDDYFASKPPQFYSDGIQGLRRRWGHVIDNNGEYIVD